MKYLMLSILTIALFACDNSEKDVTVGERTSMEVNKVFEAGKVVKGELVRARFKVTNTGDSPLVFGSVKPSCTCTVTDSPKEPIQPGKSGYIVATIDTDKVPRGKVERKVTVTTNTSPTVTELVIRATVIDK